MREKYLWLAIAVLVVLTLGQARFIHKHSLAATEDLEQQPLRPEIQKSFHAEKASDSRWEEFETWRDKIKGQLNLGTPLQERDFDVFFNDRFFSRDYNPFTEMEHIHRQMRDVFAGPKKTLFDNYWDKWFAQRLGIEEFKVDILRANRDVTLIIYVPGLIAKIADIDITNDRIKLSFSAKISSEEKSAGGIIKKESSQSYVKILPIPEEAAANTGKMEIDGERVKIKFDLKKSEK
ncbi:MAG: hypothetical protein NTX59_07345 [Elusimicrobia bacterium]|nr:hypothetical protein [Elusimicrobiota bacterium]